MTSLTLLARMQNRTVYYISLVGLVIVSLASYGLASIASGDNSQFIGLLTVAQYTVMAGLMLTVWKSSPHVVRIKDLSALLIIAVFVRIALLDATPFTSNDTSRYLFDGKIAVEGFDPYRTSHDHPSLSELRQQWHPPAEHAKYVTLYPPLALALFSVASSTGIDNALLTWRLMLLTASLLTLWLTVRVLQRANKLRHLALVALSPLLILETHVGLHLDAFSALAVIAAIYCWQRQWHVRAGFVIGLGTVVKMLPLMLLLPLVFTSKTIGQATRLAFATLLTIISIYLSAYLLDFEPVGSIAVFFEKWRFGAPLFTVLDSVLSAPIILLIMISVATIVCSISAYFCWCNRHTLANNEILLIGVMQLVIALPLILSPVTFPWYLMPLIPLTALYPNRYLIIWTILMPLTFEVIGPFSCCDIWQPAHWPIWLIGGLQLTALLALINYCYASWPVRNTMTVSETTN